MPLLCYDCKRQTKSKSKDENKTHFLCMFSKFSRWKIKRQVNRKRILLQVLQFMWKRNEAEQVKRKIILKGNITTYIENKHKNNGTSV